MAILCLIFWLLAASRVQPEALPVVRLLEARYAGARTLRTTFIERYLENGRQVRIESGTAYFRRPGKMRWEYESPETKLFLSDGHTIWFYVPADRTALRSRAKKSSDWRTPFRLLTKSPRLSDLCEKVALGFPAESSAPENRVLHCLPRGVSSKLAEPAQSAAPEDGAPAEEEILLEVAPDSGDLRRVVIREAGGVELEFRFSNWERNPVLDDSQFAFHPPLGVALVEAEPPR